MRLGVVLLAALALAGLGSGARAQVTDGPNAAFANELVTVNLGDHSITGLLTYTPGQTRFRHVYALFPGTAALVVDAPSDRQGAFSLEFRSSLRYAADVKALTDEVDRRAHGPAQWTLVGTSEGSVSVALPSL